jgi:acetyltransferase-like isoleucine patch superfamily enzyme
MRGAELASESRIYFGVDINRYDRVKMGRASVLYKHITIALSKRGRFVIGEDAHLAPYCYLLVDEGKLEIGNDVAIGPYCTFFCRSNSYSKEEKLFRKNYKCGDIIIGNNVFIGAQCTILPGSVIQNDVIVAANSTVNGTLESGFIYGGSPIKKIKQIS